MSGGALNEREAAAAVGVSVHTLRRWRREGRGPSYLKHPAAKRASGRGSPGRVAYLQADVDEYLAAIRVPTEPPGMP